MDTAPFEAAGLYDPRAPDAAERLALLEWLVARGVSLEDMLRYRKTSGLPGLTADAGMRPGPRLNLAEVAAAAGVSPEEVKSIRLAAGLPPAAPDERLFSADDAPTFASFTVAAALFGATAVRRFVRVMGAAAAAVAEAAVSLFLLSVERPIREAGGNETTLALANQQAMERLELVPLVMRGLLRAHLEVATRRSRVARRFEAMDTARLTVGFVDLVGFTALSRRIAARDLTEVIDRFEDAAHEIATKRDGRIVKLIGDEVMFVTLSAAAACDIALSLVEQFAGDATIHPRGALATGDLIVRAGDYFGPIVNLASRLAELAVPGELLVTTEVAAEAGGVLAFRPAGKRLPKGLDAPVEVLTVERR